MEQWLSLHEYASKHHTSISTLRRRIKNKEVPFKMLGGRYYVLDHAVPTMAPATTTGVAPAPAPVAEPAPNSSGAVVEAAHLQESAEIFSSGSEPLVSTASKLLSELKRAYSSVLQEKEEQIVQLKEEVSDLRTLVRVLEQEVERLKGRPAPWQSK